MLSQNFINNSGTNRFIKGKYSREQGARRVIGFIRWSAIAANLPGRSDNDIKNYWQTNLQRAERSSRSASGQEAAADVSKEKQSSRVTKRKKIEEYYSSTASTDVTCIDPNMSSRKRQKSCDDLFILESSSSNSVVSNSNSTAFEWDLNL
ncbi:hypothetical protein ACS0TY_027092 [Phlomoides rotata]